jgi:hypothetical protein
MRTITSTVAVLASSLSLALGGEAVAQSRAPLPSTLATPNVYVVPLAGPDGGSGQMGTDINMQLFERYIEDIKKTKPDIIVIDLFSADVNQNFYLQDDDRGEFGLGLIEDYRGMVKRFQEDLRDIPQIMWVRDSVGFGSLIALAWPELYIRSDGRIMGLSRVGQMAGGWEDPDVASKMDRAIKGMANGFLEQGGYPLVLGEAMMTPSESLSIKFEGRNVVWMPDASGVWIVDNSPEQVANFSALLAEESGLAKGVADDLGDLMFLLGYREYNKLENGEKIGKSYVEDWRKAFDRCRDWLRDAIETDEDSAGLARRVSLLGNIVDAMKRYPAIEYKARIERMPSRMELELLIDNLKKDIARMKEAEKRNRGSGGGGRGGGGGMGGLGGGR